MTPQGATTSFNVPAGRGPNDIVLGPDGALWFTEKTSNSIGRITTAGRYRSFPVPTAASQPFGIAVGPDRNIWFTEFAGGKIGKIVPGDDLNEGTTPLPAVKDTTKPSAGLDRPVAHHVPRRELGRLGQRKEEEAQEAHRDQGLVLAVRGRQGDLHGPAQGPRAPLRQALRGPKRSNRKKKRCTRYVAVRGSFTVKGTAGKNTLHLPRPAEPPQARGGLLPPDGHGHRPGEERVGAEAKAFRIVK